MTPAVPVGVKASAKDVPQAASHMTANLHPECGHGNNESTYTCCICDHNPCDGVTVAKVMDHSDWEAAGIREGWSRAVDYAIKHRHREPEPF